MLIISIGWRRRNMCYISCVVHIVYVLCIHEWLANAYVSFILKIVRMPSEGSAGLYEHIVYFANTPLGFLQPLKFVKKIEIKKVQTSYTIHTHTHTEYTYWATRWFDIYEKINEHIIM